MANPADILFWESPPSGGGAGGFPRGGGMPMAPPGGAGGAPLSGMGQRASVVLLPPTVIRPPRSSAFHLFGRGTLLTSANTPAIIPASTFTIPQENVGVIQSVVLNINNLLATSNILWDLMFNNSPVEGWSGLTVFPTAAAFVSVSYPQQETQIAVPENTQIAARITVLDGGTYSAGMDYGGWFYDKRLDAAFESVWDF